MSRSLWATKWKTPARRQRALEMFKSSYYADLSLNQWPALAPPELLKVHLDLDQQFADALRKTKAPIVPT